MDKEKTFHDIKQLMNTYSFCNKYKKLFETENKSIYYKENSWIFTDNHIFVCTNTKKLFDQILIVDKEEII